MLVEKVERGRQRLNVRKLATETAAEPGITGGYIFKRDRFAAGETGLTTRAGVRLSLVEPKEREITLLQRQWLTDYLNDFERALFEASFAEPTNGYRKYVDVPSFIDYHWMIEATKNVDGHWFSQFFHKDRDGPIKAGPVWDWDMAFGNVRYLRSQETNGWRSDQVTGTHYAWYGRMFEDEEFLQEYVDRWAELRQTVLATTNILALIDAIAETIRPAAVRTIQRWFPPPDDKDPAREPGRRFELEVRQMRDWIRDRLSWIDSQEFPRPVLSEIRTNAMARVILTAKWSVGQCFYTTDGSDPRVRGGAVGAGAREYFGPVQVPGSSPITFRVRSPFGLWSAPVVCQPAKLDHRDPE